MSDAGGGRDRGRDELVISVHYNSSKWSSVVLSGKWCKLAFHVVQLTSIRGLVFCIHVDLKFKDDCFRFSGFIFW